MNSLTVSENFFYEVKSENTEFKTQINVNESKDVKWVKRIKESAACIYKKCFKYDFKVHTVTIESILYYFWFYIFKRSLSVNKLYRLTVALLLSFNKLLSL